MKKSKHSRMTFFSTASHKWFAENVAHETSRWNLAIVGFRAENGDAQCKEIMVRYGEWCKVRHAVQRLTS